MVMAVVNLGLILAYAFLRSRFDDPVSIGNALFFVLLLTLLVTLFDRYRQVYLMRFGQPFLVRAFSPASSFSHHTRS